MEQHTLAHFLHVVAPTEIVKFIFDELHRSTLHSLVTLTGSRKLHTVALEVLWQDRRLVDDDYVNFARFSGPKYGYANLIKSLTIDTLTTEQWHDFFTCVVPHLISLRKLILWFRIDYFN